MMLGLISHHYGCPEGALREQRTHQFKFPERENADGCQSSLRYDPQTSPRGDRIVKHNVVASSPHYGVVSTDLNIPSCLTDALRDRDRPRIYVEASVEGSSAYICPDSKWSFDVSHIQPAMYHRSIWQVIEFDSKEGSDRCRLGKLGAS